MKKGDIVLVPFPFTDLQGNKTRPALIIINSEEDVTVCFITTQIHWQDKYDLLITPSEYNGLKRSSLIRLSKFATLDKSLILGRLGTLEEFYIKSININLIHLLRLDE